MVRAKVAADIDLFNAQRDVWAWWVASGSQVAHYDSRCARSRVAPYRRKYIRAHGMTIPAVSACWSICRSCPKGGPIAEAIRKLGEAGLI